jgi:hypothetical protein
MTELPGQVADPGRYLRAQRELPLAGLLAVCGWTVGFHGRPRQLRPAGGGGGAAGGVRLIVRVLDDLARDVRIEAQQDEALACWAAMNVVPPGYGDLVRSRDGAWA